MSSPEPLRQHLRRIAVLMDAEFEGPFGIKVGLDGLLGLVPLVGDVATTIVSLYLVVMAANFGVPLSVLLRMGLHILIDNLVSSIPVLGWFFDFLYHSNLKNLALLEAYLDRPHPVARQSRLVVFGFVTGFLVLSLGLAAGATWLLYELGRALFHLLANA